MFSGTLCNILVVTLIISATTREGSRECGEGEGDCSLDSDCSGSLVCGTDNCLAQFSKSGERWGPGDDCCTRWPGMVIGNKRLKEKKDRPKPNVNSPLHQ